MQNAYDVGPFAARKASFLAGSLNLVRLSGNVTRSSKSWSVRICKIFPNLRPLPLTAASHKFGFRQISNAAGSNFSGFSFGAPRWYIRELEETLCRLRPCAANNNQTSINYNSYWLLLTMFPTYKKKGQRRGGERGDSTAGGGCLGERSKFRPSSPSHFSPCIYPPFSTAASIVLSPKGGT